MVTITLFRVYIFYDECRNTNTWGVNIHVLGITIPDNEYGIILVVGEGRVLDGIAFTGVREL